MEPSFGGDEYMSEEYAGNPLGYAQSLLTEADKLYEIHSGDIEDGKDHLQLKSDHLEARAGIPGRSAHYFPELYPAMKSRAANIYDVMRTGDPAIKLDPADPDIPGIKESVQRLEGYVNDSFLHGQLWEDLYKAFLNAEYCPYSAAYLGWDDRWGPLPEYDQIENKLIYRDWIIYSGPQLFALQPEDYRGDLFARDHKAMRYHFMIKDVSSGYILQMAKQGYYNKARGITQQELDASHTGEWAKKRITRRFNDSYVKPDDYKHEQVIAWILRWDERKQRETWRVVNFIGDLLLDEKESPWTALGAPFVVFNSQMLPGEIAGLSTAKVGAANQNAINEFWNLSIESDEQDLFAPIVFKGQITSNPIWEPQALWQVSDTFEHSPLVKPNPSRNMLEKIKFLEERNQQVLEAYDTIQPVTGKSKQTLGEYIGKKQEHSKILGVNYQFYANRITHIAKMTIAMARERLPQWIELGIFGNNSILNKLTIADLAANVVIDIPKVRALANEEMQAIKWENMYPTLIQNPLINMSPEKVYEVTERYLEAMGEKNIDKILGPRPEPQTMLGGMYGQEQGAIPEIAGQKQIFA